MAWQFGWRAAAMAMALLLPAAADAQTAYITNYGDNTVSVIDTATNTVTATIPVGVDPYGLNAVAVSPDGRRVYVTNSSDYAWDGTVWAIDTATNKVTAAITVNWGASGIAVTPDGTRAYVTSYWAGEVYVIDTATNTITATIYGGSHPKGVAVTPDGTRVYVANNWSDTVSVIDTATNIVTATIPVRSEPFGVAVTPDGTRVYVANSDNSAISVIDTATNAVTATIPVGYGPTGVAVTPDGTKVYVTGAVVYVVDTATNTVTATIPVGNSPYGVAVTPDGTRVYVANYYNDTVSVIDTATNTVTATVPVGHGPIAFGAFIQPKVSPPPACAAELPFSWPMDLDLRAPADVLVGGTGDYAVFNQLETRLKHYHTGLDISAHALAGGGTAEESVFAVARGEVVAVCPDGVPEGCPGFSSKEHNHGLQGVVILKHTLADTRVVYSLYGHLKSVEGLDAGKCIDAGTQIGVTGLAPANDNHLHFELKTEPVLENPVKMPNSCIDPGTQQPSDTCYGYLLGHPSGFGYLDPVEFFFVTSDVGFPKDITVVPFKDDKTCLKYRDKTCPPVVRKGPGGLETLRFDWPSVIRPGTYTALAAAPATTVPDCAEGWFQIQRGGTDCSKGANCFGIGVNSKGRRIALPDAWIPDAWICGAFIDGPAVP